MTGANLVIRALPGFGDAAFGRAEWNRLLATGPSDVVFLTWEWQSAWWASFGRGELRLLLAEHEGRPVALAPLFTEAGMVYFVGSGGSDYLDFIGDIGQPEVIDALLHQARASTPGFIGFVFYHVLESSETGQYLAQSAARLGLKLFDEGDLPAPALELRDEAAVLAVANKQSLRRHERFFSRDASFKVSHWRRSGDILPQLDEFFAQHRARWAATPHPSLFVEAAQQKFYRLLTSTAIEADWLRFTRLDWQGRPIAFHFGFSHRGSFLWYKPSFAIDLARHSPGEALLRQLVLAAHADGARTFDFGLGDEAFKARFATQVRRVRNWGLYDPRAVEQGGPQTK